MAWTVEAEVRRGNANRRLSLHLCRAHTRLTRAGSRVKLPGAIRVAGIRQIRSKTAELLGGNEAVLVTRYGKIFGLYLPLEDTDRIPQGLRRSLGQMLSAHLASQLAAGGRTEEEIQKAFDTSRRRHR